VTERPQAGGLNFKLSDDHSLRLFQVHWQVYAVIASVTRAVGRAQSQAVTGGPSQSQWGTEIIIKLVPWLLSTQ
jgi:hypothetical protein